MKKRISHDEAVAYVQSLPFVQFKEIDERYSKKTGKDFSLEMASTIISSMENYLAVNLCYKDTFGGNV